MIINDGYGFGFEIWRELSWKLVSCHAAHGGGSMDERGGRMHKYGAMGMK